MANIAKKRTEVSGNSTTLIASKTKSNRVANADHDAINKDIIIAAGDSKIQVTSNTSIVATTGLDASQENFIGKTVEIKNGATLTVPTGLADDFKFRLFATGQNATVSLPGQGGTTVDHSKDVYEVIHLGGDVYKLAEPGAGASGSVDSVKLTAGFTVNSSSIATHKGKTYIKEGVDAITITFEPTSAGFDLFFAADSESVGINFDFTDVGVSIINAETGDEGANLLPAGGMVWIWSDDGATLKFRGDLEGNTAPVFSSVDFDTPVTGNTVAADVVYEDNDNDLPDEANYAYQWKFAEDSGGSPDMGTLTDLAGETNNEYTVSGTIEGKWLFLEATPAAQTGISPGSPVLSSGKKVMAAAAGLWDYTDSANVKLALDSLRNTFSDEAGTTATTTGAVACLTSLIDNSHKFTESVEQPVLINTSGTRGLQAAGVTKMLAGDILDDLFNPTNINDKRTYVMLFQMDQLDNNLLFSKDSASDGFKITPNQNRLKYTQGDDRNGFELNSQVATDQDPGVPNDNVAGSLYLWSIEVDEDPLSPGNFRHRYYLGGDEINVGYLGTRQSGLSAGAAGTPLQLFGGSACYITLFGFAALDTVNTDLRESCEQRMAWDHGMESLLGAYSGSHTYDSAQKTL